jgi:hypothetical protein
VLRRKSGAGVSRDYFDVSSPYDVHALRLISPARVAKTARVPGKTPRKTLDPSGTIVARLGYYHQLLDHDVHLIAVA